MLRCIDADHINALPAMRALPSTRASASSVQRVAAMSSLTKGLPYLPWFPSSFMSSTRGWSVTARGIYRELLDCQWEMGALPGDAKELRQMIGATPAEWREWRTVEPKFPVCSDGRRRNDRLEAHRNDGIERRERRRQASEVANAAKAAKRSSGVVTPFRGGRDGQ